MEHLGLVGLADSGHDRLFAALTGLAVGGAAERTVGVVKLPDERLDRLADMSSSQKVVPATFEIAYVPGLAPEPGKGLGSRLLGTLRDCDAILFVLRADGVDPADDLATIEYELVLADLASVEQRLAKQQRLAKGDKSLLPEIAALAVKRRQPASAAAGGTSSGVHTISGMSRAGPEADGSSALGSPGLSRKIVTLTDHSQNFALTPA